MEGMFFGSELLVHHGTKKNQNLRKPCFFRNWKRYINLVKQRSSLEMVSVANNICLAGKCTMIPMFPNCPKHIS